MRVPRVWKKKKRKIERKGRRESILAPPVQNFFEQEEM